MSAVGIIAEYNPFHKGHLYQLEHTRRAFPGKGVVIVMSGNFVQRGELAIANKHARAKCALLCGADVVFELPVPFVLSPAERFGAAGVALLQATGVCNVLSFGSECGDVELIKKAAEALPDEKAFEAAKASGVSYGEALSAALPGFAAKLIATPNNLLGCEYVRAIKRLGAKMTPFTVKREDGHFSGLERAFPSAGAVRRALFESGHLPEGALPGATERVLAAEREEGRFPVDGRVLDRAVIASLRKLTPGELSEMAEVSEGLENRILAAAKSAASVAKLVNAVKTRRYTEARIRRIIMSAFLCIDRTLQNGNVPYLRLLGISERGRELLSQMKERATLPVITKPATLPKDNPYAAAERRSDDLYALAYPDGKNAAAGGFDRSSPVIAAKITDFGDAF